MTDSKPNTDSRSGADAPVSDCRHPRHPSRHPRAALPSTVPDGGSTTIKWNGRRAHEVPAAWPSVKPLID